MRGLALSGWLMPLKLLEFKDRDLGIGDLGLAASNRCASE